MPRVYGSPVTTTGGGGVSWPSDQSVGLQRQTIRARQRPAGRQRDQEPWSPAGLSVTPLGQNRARGIERTLGPEGAELATATVRDVAFTGGLAATAGRPL